MILNKINRIFMFSITLPLGLLVHAKTYAEQTNIAVASNFSRPMNVIKQSFEKETGHSLRLIFGSSGKLYAQIQNNAPFDAFLSADETKPKALILAKKAIAESLFTYAIGSLVLWNPRQDGNALKRLKDGQYNKLAIANPRLAPYGAAAMHTLENLELNLSASSKLVKGENIAQTYQFVDTGNAQLGFVAKSQLIKDGQLPDGTWQVPENLHEVIRQNAVLLERGKNNAAALSLLEFLRSERAKNIIRHYGYRSEE